MSVVASAPARAAVKKSDPIRVMLVDDSAVIRGLISRWIEAESDLTVAASLRTGRDAVNQLERIDPDVAVLDIEMPDLDGISALPLLLAKKRDLIIIMASTLTRRNAEVSLKALSLGAADYIPKPETTRELGGADAFRHDLVQKIRHLGARVRRTARTVTAPPLAPGLGRVRESHAPAVAAPQAVPHVPVTTRPLSHAAPRVLVVGSSTGGPQALMTLVGGLGKILDHYPKLITQHMPPTFTPIFADHLARPCRRPQSD